MSKDIILTMVALTRSFKIGRKQFDLGDICVADVVNNKLLTAYGPVDIKASDYRIIKQEEKYAEHNSAKRSRTNTKGMAREAKKSKADGSSTPVRPPSKRGSSADKERSPTISKRIRKGKDWGLRGE